MFEDNDKEEMDSSDDSFDSEEEKLHLVKSQSNVSRNRAHYGAYKQGNNEKYNQNQKYDRKNKAKYVAVKGQDIQKMLKSSNTEGQVEKVENKKMYEAKKEGQNKYPQKESANKEYEDEECYQDCKVKIKTEENPQEKKGSNNQNVGNNYYKGKKNNKNNYKGGEGEGNKGKKKFVEKK